MYDKMLNKHIQVQIHFLEKTNKNILYTLSEK